MNTQDIPKILKPYIKIALLVGGKDDNRIEMGHMIVSELKKRGNNRDKILGAMAVWNLRNWPHLSNQQLITIVDAGSKHDYSFDCKTESVMRTLTCIGDEKCEYFKKYLETKPIDGRKISDEDPNHEKIENHNEKEKAVIQAEI